MKHIIALLLENEPGALSRVVGLFSARGYNIESLTVADISEDHELSRITIVTSGPPAVVDQIIAQLDRMVVVHKVTDLSDLGPHVEREMALLKVRGSGDKRLEAMRLADIYRARVVDATIESFVFEITGSTEKVDTFIMLMREVGLIEVARGGVVAISRGKDAA